MSQRGLFLLSQVVFFHEGIFLVEEKLSECIFLAFFFWWISSWRVFTGLISIVGFSLSKSFPFSLAILRDK